MMRGRTNNILNIFYEFITPNFFCLSRTKLKLTLNMKFFGIATNQEERNIDHCTRENAGFHLKQSVS